MRLGLKGFEADLTVLLGAGFADPHYATFDGIQFIVAGNNLNELAALQPESATEAEALGRAVHNEAGDALGVRAEIDDHAGSLSHGDTLRAAAFVRREGGHCFVLDGEFPHCTIME